MNIKNKSARWLHWERPTNNNRRPSEEAQIRHLSNLGRISTTPKADESLNSISPCVKIPEAALFVADKPKPHSPTLAGLRRPTGEHSSKAAQMELYSTVFPAEASGSPAEVQRLLHAGLAKRHKRNLDALEDFDQALALDPSNRTALLHRAATILASPPVRPVQLLDSADRNVETALRFYPTDRFAQILNALAYQRGLAHGPAVPYLEELARERPQDADISTLLTLAYYHDGMTNPDRSQKDIQKAAKRALKLRPNDDVSSAVMAILTNSAKYCSPNNALTFFDLDLYIFFSWPTNRQDPYLNDLEHEFQKAQTYKETAR